MAGSGGGGAGGVAGTGGGAGGKGGGASTTPGAGGAPGGGQGGIGGGGGSQAAPSGQVKLTYSTGAPAILLSAAAAAGTDKFGTAYPAGTVIAPPVAIPDSSAPAALAGSVRLYGAGGHLKYVSGGTGDTTAYTTGRTTSVLASAQLFNSATQTLVGTIQFPVAASTYRLHGMFEIDPTVSAGTANFQLTGPTIGTQLITIRFTTSPEHRPRSPGASASR